MAVQLTYTKNMPKALPGLIGWDFGTADLTSMLAEGVLPYGNAVKKGSKARTAVVGNTGVLGFVARSLMSIYAIDNNVDAHGPKEMAAIMREGYLWTTNKSATGVVDNAAVYVNASGELVNTGDAGAALVPGCSIEIGGAAGAMVLIRIQTTIPAPAAP
jgi:hypothetical protein